MTLSTLLTQTATIKRLTSTTGIKRTWQQVATGVACLVQPRGDETEARNVPYLSHRGYFNVGANIQKGDQVTVNSKVFTVQSIRNYNYGSAAVQHIEANLIHEVKAQPDQ